MNISGEQIATLFGGLAGFLGVYKTGGAILKARKIRLETEFNDKVSKVVKKKLEAYHKVESDERNKRKDAYEKQFAEHEEEVDRLITKLADNEARENAIEMSVNDLSNKIENLKDRFNDRLKS